METIFKKLGGRKFVAALVCIVSGTLIEIYAANGLSVNMAGLIAAIYATFSASNTMITRKQLEGEHQPAPAAPPPQPSSQPDMQQLASQLVPVLNQIGTALQELKDGQAAGLQANQVLQQGMSNLQKVAQVLLTKN